MGYTDGTSNIVQLSLFYRLLDEELGVPEGERGEDGVVGRVLGGFCEGLSVGCW